MTGLLILFAFALGLNIVLLVLGTVRYLERPERRTAAWAIARDLPADPDDLRLEFQRVVIDRPDGPPIEVWDIACEKPDGPIVILLHVWWHSRVDVLLWLEALGPACR
ncbi:MAG: hypothetical protein ACYTGQ_07190, partial [Planctomycetota bacterium]